MKIILISLSLVMIANISVLAQDMTIDANGNVGIGTPFPAEKLSVNGIIESTSGGIKFPDGTVQVTSSLGGNGGGAAYARVAIVAQGGGDYTDPLSAMTDIATWCGIPSASNPCLLKIMPGTYDVGTESLQMLDYVDIEGSGETTTRITGNRDAFPGVVAGSNNAEIRFITVENTGGGAYAWALTMYNTSPKVTNVTARASDGNENVGIGCVEFSSAVITNVTSIASGGTNSLGFYIENASPILINVQTTASDASLNLGIDMNVNASPRMINVRSAALRGIKSHAFHINGTSSPAMTDIQAVATDATNENFGVYNVNSSSPKISNMIAEASGGANNIAIYTRNFETFTGGTVNIDHSIIRGTTNAVYTDTTFAVFIGNSRIGGSLTGGGMSTCAGVYDENYVFYSSTCP